MNSLIIVLPYDFVAKRINLTWRDILYAIERRFITPRAAIEHAMNELSKTDNYPQSLVDLASLSKSESVHPYVDDLADMEFKQPDEEIDDRWLYLLLAWIYENKDKYEDPPGMVEYVYADFNYPDKIKSFVKYMPSEEPNLGSKELNEARLYKKWKDYLNEQEKRFASNNGFTGKT